MKPDKGTKRLIGRAGDVTHIARSHATIDDAARDPKFQAAARLLLETAVAWRDNARRRVIDDGGEPKPRPKFSDVPPIPAEPVPISLYRRTLIWWASRYAWDVADGLPQQEAIAGLLTTAAVGHQKKKEGPKAFPGKRVIEVQDNGATFGTPLQEP